MLTQLRAWAVPKYNTFSFNTEPHSLTASNEAHKTSLSHVTQNKAQCSSLQSNKAIIANNQAYVNSPEN